MAELVSENNGFTILWKIENYSYHSFENYESFVSPIFLISGLNQSEWRLKLYPLEAIQNSYGNTGNHLGIEIEKVGGQTETLVEISFNFVTSHGLHYLDKVEKRKFNINDTHISYIHHSKLSNFSELTPFDTLNLICHLWNQDTSVNPSRHYTGSTQINVEKHSLEWSWKNISTAGFYESHVEWKKTLFPKCDFNPQVEMLIKTLAGKLSVSFQFLNADESYRYMMGINVFVFNCEKKEIYSKKNKSKVKPNEIFEFSIIDRDKTKINPASNDPSTLLTLRFDMTFSSSKMCSQIGKCYYLSDKYETDDKAKEDIRCTQETLRDDLVKEVISKPVQVGTDSLLNDLSLFLTEKKLCDVAFKIGGKEFSAHRTIVCARSPVFCTMFESDMQENESGVVNIDDIDSDTFEIFLNYLYRGKIDHLNGKIVVSLYSIADKYQVPSLKRECSSFIMNHLDEENVCDFLVLSDMHQDEELKTAAQKTFCAYSKTILLSKDWATLLLKKPELAIEILQKMALHMQQAT